MVAAAVVVAMLSLLGLAKTAAALATVWSRASCPAATRWPNVATGQC